MQSINSVNYNKNPNFTSRISQIRDAQWVVHTVNSTFPHFSPTKFKRIFEHYIQKSDKRYSNLIFKDYTELYWFVKKQVKNNDNIFSKLKELFSSSKQKKRKNMFDAIERNIRAIGDLRSENKENGSLTDNTIDMLYVHKKGNCNESAILAEFIMKINGMNNAETCILYPKGGNMNKAFHNACIFNIDNTPFNRIINNKTIIIDPWIGKADFANNMLKYYKNNCEDLLSIPGESKIDLISLSIVYLTDSLSSNYKKRFPQIIFNSKSHKFME